MTTESPPNYYALAEKAFSGLELKIIRAALLAVKSEQKHLQHLGAEVLPLDFIEFNYDDFIKYFHTLDPNQRYYQFQVIEKIRENTIIDGGDFEKLSIDFSVFIKIKDRF